MGDRLALFLAAMALVFLGGVAYTGLTAPERPPQREYTLEIQAGATADGVEANGMTNLPDGSRLYVYADRLYRLQDSDVWSAARVGEAEVLVRGGRWAAAFETDDAEWVNAVGKRINKNEFAPVEAVQSSLRTTVLFSPQVPQSKAIQDEMGPNFEGLSRSDQAIRQGEYWILRHFDTVEKPLRRDLEARLTPSRAMANIPASD